MVDFEICVCGGWDPSSTTLVKIKKFTGQSISSSLNLNVNNIGGCACFEIKVFVDACTSASPPGGMLQEIKHGSICDLKIC